MADDQAPPWDTDLPSAFARLFAGLERAHGRYLVPAQAKPNGAGKVEGKPWTAKKAITAADWAAHLSGALVTVPNGDGSVTGTLGLGVVPIRDDATCVFGAIDVDVYPLDLAKLAADAESLRLPLVLCRTKSGGAHGYLFMTEPTPAELVRTRLMEWAVLLGHPGVEVFPKQVRLAGEKDDGSWINIPYAGGARSVRYALDPITASALTPEEFVLLADARAMTAAELEAFRPELGAVGEEGELFAGGPPCLRVLAQRGFPEGTRNNALFNVAVYLKKRYGDAAPYLADYNRRFMDPPLDDKDVAAVLKSSGKKTYSYKCKDQPIAAVCNRQVCLGCEFGVGGQSDDPGVVLGDLVKLRTEPPTWLWDVDGARIELTTEEVMDQRKFHSKVIETLNKWPSMVKPTTWQNMVRDRLKDATVVQVPEDATREGQMWVHLARFCTSRVVGRSIDELLLGKPFTDEDEGRTYFCSSDLLGYLQQHRVSGVGEKELFKWLRGRGVDHHFKNIKGKGVNCWSVPAFDRQTQPFDVPRQPPGDAM